MSALLMCLCCGDPMEVEATKGKRKPYAHCDPCGVQTFVRGQRGVKYFEAKYGTAWRDAPRVTPPEPPEPPEPPAKEAEKGATRGRRGLFDY